MTKIAVNNEICQCFRQHFKMHEIRIIHPDILYQGVYEGYLMEDKCAIIPFGSWVEIYPPTEYQLVNERKEN